MPMMSTTPRVGRIQSQYRPFSGSAWTGKTLKPGQIRQQEAWNYRAALKQAGGLRKTTIGQRVQMQNVNYGVGNSPLAKYAARTAKFRTPRPATMPPVGG